MGKKKKTTMKQENGGDSQHSPATVFVSNFPYSFTNSQLEETFSDVGPIRRCFMVTQKGSTEHRGFGFVQFAVTEDANRAIELKNGSSVGGRTIGVKHAMHRAPLEQRRAKGGQVVPSDSIVKEKDDKDDSLFPSGDVIKTEENNDDNVKEDSSKPTVKDKQASKGGKTDKPKIAIGPLKTVQEEGVSSEKQRVARTVIIGGLLNDSMAEDVHSHARECGTVSSITYPLSREDIEHHGLSQDGCRLGASSILYTSVKSARACVAKLHQQKLGGGLVWARQLGGEGSKTQKWKLIIRNLPFKASVSEIKEMFSSAGFVWDVFIPRKPDSGLPKGFAFVKFTCKQDAENALQKFNGSTFGKRPIAIDWAVPKKVYTTGIQVSLEDGQKGSDEEDDSASDLEDMDKNEMPDAIVPDGSDSKEEEVDFTEEADIARKVLHNLLASSKASDASVSDNSAMLQESKDDGTVNKQKKTSDGLANVPDLTKPEDLVKSEPANVKPSDGVEDLQRTLFICNLPFDVTNEEVKQRFTAFGEVQSFVPVLHKVTKRPSGNGFLKFRTVDAADAAFSAANVAAGLGIILKGRQLKLLKALDKKTAHDKEVEKTKKEETDHRNLYLAKEGLILEGTPAAEGVSDSDMSKRKSLEQKKATKLRSPNFHVSKTRLIMYNIPKSMNEKQLKKLCIDAVITRATKQKPTIQQIKLLKDSKKGTEASKSHSRGVAFIEFTEHQHALVALRVLNNNPETFTREHRPIVEFALDNIQTLRQRNDKIQAQQQGSSDHTEKAGKNVNFQKSSNQSNERKRKPQSTVPEKETEGNEKVVIEEGKHTKKQKGHLRGENNIPKKKLTSSKKALENQQEGKSGVTMERSAFGETRPIGKVAVGPNKKRLRDQKELQNEGRHEKRSKRNRNKDPLGQDMVDKLDMLIEQYRSKFSRNSSNSKSEGETQGAKRLGRWFQ